MLLKNENVTKEPKQGEKKYLGANENENVTTQNLSDAVKVGQERS